MQQLIYDVALEHVHKYDIPTVVVPITIHGEPRLVHGSFRGHDETSWNAAAHDPDNQVALAVMCCHQAHHDARRLWDAD